MNAPWKPGMATTRDAFHAYVCDNNSAQTVTAIAIEMGWPSEHVQMGGLRGAIQALSVSASPHILLVDLSEAADPLTDISGLAEVCEPGTIVIACGQVNDVRLYRELLSTGLQDYLLKPLNIDHLRDAITNAQAAFMAPRGDQEAAHNHVAIAVIGTRGGVGASTVATSLGWMMSETKGRTTALLDLDLHFGTHALTLDLDPGRGLIDAIENPSRIDGLFIERAMVRATDKLAILSAEAPINQSMLTDGGAFHQLLSEFRSAFECAIIDLPRDMLNQFPQLMQDIQVAIVVTDVTLAAARDTIRTLSWLRSNAPHVKTLLVAGKMHTTTPEISRKDFEQSVERAIDIVLPWDLRLSAQAAKLGKPIVEVAKNSKLGHAYATLPDQILAQVGDTDAEASVKSTTLLGKLGGIKGLLSSASKKDGKGQPSSRPTSGK
ncbi:MAG: pilus assembly protein CpaE [Sphingobium sp.]|nr:pilus assembly protein CpaE [Sphingobium sp.]